MVANGGAKGRRPVLEVSAQVKAKKMTKAILDVLFLDKDGKWISHKWAAYIGSKKPGDPPANHDWKKYSGKVEIPPRTAKLCIGLQVYGPGKVWFDDVQASYGTADQKNGKPNIDPRMSLDRSPQTDSQNSCALAKLASDRVEAGDYLRAMSRCGTSIDFAGPAARSFSRRRPFRR